MPQKKAAVKRASLGKIEEKLPAPKTELPKPHIKSSSKIEVPVPSGLTPIRRSLEKVSIDDNQSDLEKSKSSRCFPNLSKVDFLELNLKYWREYQSDQKMVIETALKKLKEIDSSNVT